MGDLWNQVISIYLVQKRKERNNRRNGTNCTTTAVVLSRNHERLLLGKAQRHQGWCQDRNMHLIGVTTGDANSVWLLALYGKWGTSVSTLARCASVFFFFLCRFFPKMTLRGRWFPTWFNRFCLLTDKCNANAQQAGVSRVSCCLPFTAF